MKSLYATGAIVNAALYLSGVFIGSLIAHAALAEYLAVASAGATYIAYVLDFGGLESLGMWTAAKYFRPAPIVLGLASGAALILN